MIIVVLRWVVVCFIVSCVALRSGVPMCSCGGVSAKIESCEPFACDHGIFAVGCGFVHSVLRGFALCCPDGLLRVRECENRVM